ncbi:MAG TPA: DNA-directed RNA polymerase subunit beta, partial [Nitrospirota bacterium]|nr:DNA-directed RNA polymerase subunit beta [Nitrospirota bacterium]
MSNPIIKGCIERKDFSKLPSKIEIPELLEIQKKSFEKFLQKDIAHDHKEETGLQAAFDSVFPISDFNGTAILRFTEYSLGEPKYEIWECIERGMTFAAPLKIRVNLEILEKDEKSGTRSTKEVREQWVYLGELPLMTENGTFIINGTERVVVSQLQRSPGTFFTHDKGRTHISGKVLFSARIIPYRGSWLDFEFDTKDILHARIDRRRKFPVTILLKAIGYSTHDILKLYYPIEDVAIRNSKFYSKVDAKVINGSRIPYDILSEQTGEVVVKKSSRITHGILKKLDNQGIKEVPVTADDMVDRIIFDDVVDSATGEVIVGSNTILTEALVNRILQSGIEKINLLYIDNFQNFTIIRDTLSHENIESQESAIIEIYKRLRPGESPTSETAKIIFDNLFFNSRRYDLAPVGRLKLNKKLGIDVPLSQRTLTPQDIVETIRYLVNLKSNKGEIDDIDHLGNRRVRCVGELLENQFRIGLSRMERSIKERMNILDIESALPHDLINAKSVIAAVKEFFGSSQLSQFMDQTNPLSEITHKRRLSALGPGGLTRERAGFEVRDVHPTHYGRICPIETPEGPNIGLITSLSTYARVNEYGFIESPYRKVINGKVSDDVIYLSAIDGDKYYIAQANTPVNDTGKIVSETVSARFGGDFVTIPSDKVEFMDVSPKQIVSVATSLIPFLENDDANRALMGSNMQRQAVPLIHTDAPLVGTGMEKIVARDSGRVVLSRRPGVVEYVDANRIVVRAEEAKASEKSKKDRHLSDGISLDTYNLTKFKRSNQNTCINQKPIVASGQKVEKGEVLADGPATSLGELALGQNILVAFMPWEGYNFEDAIIISERLVKDDRYTSIHIEEFEIESRDTKLGKEEITRDIPNVSEELLRNLDESGIVRIGAEVVPGDILVAKV